nr:orotidine-5'-phosphate decarboxylase [bacterium]
MMHAMDRLIEAIGRTGNPTVAGLDTRIEYIPEGFLAPFAPDGVWTLERAGKAIFAYNQKLLEAFSGIVPCVKVQVAYYEMYGVPGMQAFYDTLKLAHDMGYVTIADVKRNDIGATAGAYATAYLGQTPLPGGGASAFPCDFVTVNPYLGTDGIAPFVEH